MKYRISSARSTQWQQACLHPFEFSKTQMTQYIPDFKAVSIGVFDGEFEDTQTRQQQLQQLGIAKCLHAAYLRLFFH